MTSTQVLPTLPNREELRAYFDTAVQEIGKTRAGLDLTNGFYAETGDSVFDAGYLALLDHCKVPQGPQRVHTVSAPAGGGKTTFSYALIKAVTQNAQQNPNAPYGCVFVVDQIKKADDAFHDLNELLPGQVAVWSSEHDRERKKREKLLAPSAEFTRDELRLYPVVVVTHQFYNSPNGHKANVVVRDGQFHHNRALIMVDERPDEVEYFEITLKEAQAAREALEDKRPDLRQPLEALLTFISPYTLHIGDNNRINRVTDQHSQQSICEQLHWFITEAASDVAKEHGADIGGLKKLFGYAKALTLGHAITATSGTVVYYVGWQSKLSMRRGAGTVLLDATADIDGVSQIVPWRTPVKVPQARYDNLEIIHVPQHTRKRLKEYFMRAANRRAYASWMEDVIKKHVQVGENALVVCHKTLFDNEHVPSWPQGDPRFERPEHYTTQYGWEIDGRKLCATHWGNGIGRNDWKDADVVLLFDEFFIPRRVHVATVQGLREHRANEGALASMTTLNSNSSPVKIIAEGHRLRFTKQMALRGRGRCYDQQGVCGRQRLVVSSDLRSFMANAGKLFPGAKIATVGGCSEGATWTHRIIGLLSRPNLPAVVTTKQISAELKRPWRMISGSVRTPDFFAAIEALGWQYVQARGRGGSRFERVAHAEAKVA